MGNRDGSFNVDYLFEEEGGPQLRMGDDGRAYRESVVSAPGKLEARISNPVEDFPPDGGGRSRMGPPPAPKGMGGTDRTVRARAAAPRKMTEAEMMAWAQSQMGDVQAQSQAHQAMGPAIQASPPEPRDYLAMLDDNVGRGASQHKAEMGHSTDDGPKEVPEWLTRYMADQR